MTSPTPADRINTYETVFQDTVQLWEQQSENLQQQYQKVATTLARALIEDSYTLTLQLPHQIIEHNTPISVDAKLVFVHIGNLINYLQRRPCQPAILRTFTALQKHTSTTIVHITRLVCFLAARRILFDHIPDNPYIERYFNAFDAHGELNVAEDQAVFMVTRLTAYMDHLRNIETLFAAWAIDDQYNDKYSAIVNMLLAQGRALANYHTRQLTSELLTRWKNNELIRGLTLFVPYLDERNFQMKRYQVIVIPTGRISFRPEFVVSACRLAQQDVRKSPGLSQSTRWQLTSQLDAIAQAFELQKS